MKKLAATILALSLALSLAVPASAAAAGTTFVPSTAPGATTGETQVATGIPGMTLTIGADNWTVGDTTVTSDSGVTYSGYMVGGANPKLPNKTGTYYIFSFDSSVNTGTLEIMVRQGGDKQFFILDNGTAMSGYDGSTITATANVTHTIIVQGGHSYTVYTNGSKLRLYGCTFKNVDPSAEFASEIAGFSFDKIKGTNADPAKIDENLVLIDSYESRFGSCDVNWTSSNPAAIDIDGAVNCQPTETKVTLTGHFQVQENRSFKADVVFDLTVAADPDDNSAVATAAEALTLGDTSSVKKNMTLPTAGKRGTTVTWTTSDATVVGADGKVYPASDKDKSAVLTATVTRGSATAAKTFDVTVAAMTPITVDSYSYATADGTLLFTPAAGCVLNSVSVTCNNPNPGANDVIVITVVGANGSAKGSKTVSVKDAFAGIPEGKSTAIPVGLAMAAGDTFQVAAKNSATGEEYITPYTPDETVAPGAVIYVVGDSTASIYGDERYPRKGWAQKFEEYFTGVTVTDLALSGRASGSFKHEANYTTLRNSLKKGDYLVVQFGHNDSKAESYTDPAGSRFTDGSFKASMMEYVELAWEKGAHPILATSISRRKASDASLESYVKATRELAVELNIPCIDLYACTNGWINSVGVEAAKDMFNYVKKDDPRFVSYGNFSMSEFYGKDSTDDTHINIYGADLISQWAADSLKAMGVPVASKMSAHRAQYPLPSYATGTTPAAAPAPAPVTQVKAAPVAAAATTKMAYASTQKVNMDGKDVEFQMYALKDAAGNQTNYIKLRDLAAVLDGTKAQFNVGWDGSINLETGKAYTSRNGQENKTPYSGDRAYTDCTSVTNVNGKAVSLEAFTLTDDAGNGSNYFKLRDLGKALGFNVDWSAEKGIYVETDKPYSAKN